jgi:hypothetical protein
VSIDPVLALVVRAGLALLFAAAAVHKLRAGADFRATVAAYEIVPGSLVGVAAAGIIVAETASAVALAGGQRAALAGAAGLLLLYAAALGVNLARGRRDLECGCVGFGGGGTISWALVARNLVLAAIALLGTTPAASRSLGWIDALTIVAAVTTLTALYLASDGLAANRPAVARIREAR